MIRRLAALPVLGALLLAPSPARAQESALVGLFKLPGGLEVLTSEDHARPWAVIDTFIAAGSGDDYAGYDGLAAATAYAVWHGGKQAPADQVAALGGKSRVRIERGTTVFEATVPAARVSEAIAAIGEAFSHPDWPALDVDRSAAAFDAAAKAAAANPHEQALQLYMAAAFGPEEGHAVFGHDPYPERQVLQNFFERYYVAAQTKVVLTGDVNAGKEVGQVVRGYAAVLQRSASLAGQPTRPRRPLAPPNLHPAGVLLVLGAKGPAIGNQREQAALELLGKVLAGTPTSRLDRALAALGNGSTASARWLRGVGPGILLVELQADKAHADEAKKALLDILEELRTNPVSLDEHAKAMAAAVADEEGALRELAPRALALGVAALGANDPYWVRTYPEELRQVSRQDVMAAAQKYFAPNDVKPLVVAAP